MFGEYGIVMVVFGIYCVVFVGELWLYVVGQIFVLWCWWLGWQVCGVQVMGVEDFLEEYQVGIDVVYCFV